MTTIRRLTNSCLVVTTDDGATLFDPGFWTFGSGDVDLESIGDIQRILITHEHGDHVKPEFVRWLIDRGEDVAVHSNQAVFDLLEPHEIEVLARFVEPSSGFCENSLSLIRNNPLEVTAYLLAHIQLKLDYLIGL